MQNTQEIVNEQVLAVNETENSFKLIANSIDGVRYTIDARCFFHSLGNYH